MDAAHALTTHASPTLHLPLPRHQVFSELPSYDALVPALLRGGVRGARAACALTPGVPVAPMLAKPTKGVREVLDRFEGAWETGVRRREGCWAALHTRAL
jgi:DNA ligase-1